MKRFNSLALAVILSCFAALSATAQAPKPATPISVKNAKQLRPVREVAKNAARIVRAPKSQLIFLDWNQSAEVVDEVNLRTIRPLAIGRQPTDIAISPDGKLLTWTERGKQTYTVQETATGKTFDIQIGRHPGRAAFSPDSKLLAIGFTYWDPNAHGVGYSETGLFDTKGRLIRTLKKNGPGGIRPVFSPDGKTLAVGSRNYEPQIFDVASGKLRHKLGKRMTQEIAFSPDGKTLAAGYVDGTVALWDVAKGKMLRSEASGAKEVFTLDWSPKGDVLATGGRQGKIVLWDADKLAKLKELNAPRWVHQVRFVAGGSRLLSSGYDVPARRNQYTVVVWAVAGGNDK